MQNNSFIKNKLKSFRIIIFLIVTSLIASYFDFVLPGLRYVQYILSPILAIYVLYFGLKKGKSLNLLKWFLIIFIILFVRGLLLYNYEKYILGDVISWSFVSFIVFFNSDTSFYFFKNKIPEILAKLLILFIPFSLFVFFKYGSISTEISRNLVSGDSINEKAIYLPILFSPLLLPFIVDFKRYLKITVILGNLLLVFFGIITATRGMFLFPIVSSILVLFFQKKMSIKIFFFVSILFVSFLSLGLFSENGILYEKSDYLLSRFTDDNELSNGRNSEIIDMFEKYSFTEFLIGRGAGGTHTFGFWKDIDTPLNLGANLAHYGITHLLLKGGFILAITFYMTAIWAILNLYKRGDRKFMIVIALYLILETSHNQFNNLAFLIFLWISISYSFKLSEKANMSFIK